MTPQEIEELQAGPDTDAAIEANFFGHHIIGRIKPSPFRTALYVVEAAELENSEYVPRDPRPFSTVPGEAMKILEALPHWEAWRDTAGIHVRLHKAAGDRTWLHATATDQSFCLAICKAALYLAEVIREWRNQHVKEKPEQAAWTSREKETFNAIGDRPIFGSGEADPT